MLTQSTKLKLPELKKSQEVNIQQVSQSLTAMVKSSQIFPTQEAPRVKPQYIVRRVKKADVCENYTKPHSVGSLSQINEENTYDFEDIQTLPCQTIGFDDAKKESKNIFKTETVDATKFLDHTRRGPNFHNGRVLKHTIVGSIDDFEKQDKHLEKSFNQGVTTNNLSISNNISDIKTSRYPSSSHEPNSYALSGRLRSQGGSGLRTLSAISSGRKKHRDEVKLTDREIEDELTKFKDRQETFYKNEVERQRSHQPVDQLYFTREERNLDRFEETNMKWEKTIQKISNKIGRNEQGSLMLKGPTHRERQEMTRLLEMIRTDEEKYGSRLWEKTLRKYEGGSDIESNTNNDSYDVKTKIIGMSDENKDDIFQIVRKARIIKTPIEIKRGFNQIPIITGGDYLKGKLLAKKHIIDQILPPEISEVEELIVKGNNKLDLETEAILKQTSTRQPVRVFKEYFEGKHLNQPEEIICKDRNNYEVLRNGINAYIR